MHRQVFTYHNIYKWYRYIYYNKNLKPLFQALLPYYSVVETNNSPCHDALVLYSNVYGIFTCKVLINNDFRKARVTHNLNVKF